ncbi:MAG: hypothetical protein A2901_01205 [Elusimicrobia bacterium RIFCSPLOWO2_01_FULL_54_10]|nr:MAG: hypothetical protein A2901_01205 [Elusimicrobia bacterium RIFCSPLOWO2_01_FULL_54_10]
MQDPISTEINQNLNSPLSLELSKLNINMVSTKKVINTGTLEGRAFTQATPFISATQLLQSRLAEQTATERSQ